MLLTENVFGVPLHCATNFENWKTIEQRPIDSYVFGYADSGSGLKNVLEGHNFDGAGVPILGLSTIFYSNGR